MTRDEAVKVAEILTGTTVAAVVELVLLSNGPDPVLAYRARHALEWFDTFRLPVPAMPKQAA